MAEGLMTVYATLLDSLGLAVCVFDRLDRAVHWNATFLRFFPEHSDHVYVGEPYADNLRRFYAGRLAEAEQDQIERYVEEGLVRHRQQLQPFSFVHRSRQLQVASLPTEDGHRIRVWQECQLDSVSSDQPNSRLTIENLDYFPDGVSVIDRNNAIIAVNLEFRRLYDIAFDLPIVGVRLSHIVERLWETTNPASGTFHSTVLNSLRYTGAPFEIELPGERWRRVIARQTTDGTRYVIHSDITLIKRQYRELQEAEARARASEEALQLAHAELTALAATDPLTGLANRRHFDERFELEWKRARRDGTSISLVMIDIDHFKTINDRFGHIAGDACLQGVANVILQSMRRPADIAARFGGDEFAIMLPSTDLPARCGSSPTSKPKSTLPTSLPPMPMQPR